MRAASTITTLLLVLLGGAAAQQAPAAEPFATFHQSLHSAATEALERAEREVPGARFEESEVANEAPVTDVSMQDFADRYWGGRAAGVRRAVQRAAALQPVVLPILRQEGVPDALMAVVLVESAGLPTALSPKGARGLWQFMPETAKGYGLTVSEVRDDRLHVELATRAAARHLRDLYKRFGNWELALAAYNYGSGGVQRAIGRAGSKEFATLVRARAIPAETRAYVPAIFDAARLLGLQPLHAAPVRATRPANVVYATVKQ